MSLCPYVPVPLCLRPYVLRNFVCALMLGFGSAYCIKLFSVDCFMFLNVTPWRWHKTASKHVSISSLRSQTPKQIFLKGLFLICGFVSWNGTVTVTEFAYADHDQLLDTTELPPTCDICSLLLIALSVHSLNHNTISQILSVIDNHNLPVPRLWKAYFFSDSRIDFHCITGKISSEVFLEKTRPNSRSIKQGKIFKARNCCFQDCVSDADWIYHHSR